ncbi:MAG: cation transporter [Aquificota bacterium]|nr:cation transporter [Aquificota bacterium]
MKEITVKVQGMSCDHCVRTVRTALMSLEGVSDVQVSLETGLVRITANRDLSTEEIRRAVEEWGYRLVD